MWREFVDTVILGLLVLLFIVALALGITGFIVAVDSKTRLDAIEARLDAEAPGP